MGVAPLGVPGPAQNDAWFRRNWKWVFPLGCLGVVVLLGAFVGGIFFLVENSFRHSEAYAQAMARAQANPQVLDRIGQPLKAAWLVSGSIQVHGSSGEANLSIPISGPKGKGTIFVAARRSAGAWQFDTLQVEIQGRTDRIDLLEQETPAPVVHQDTT